MAEEVVVGLVQLAQVVVIDAHRALGIAARALLQALLEHVGGRLQIDDDVRRRHILRQQLVEPLIDEQLVVVEVEKGVDAIAIEEVVRDRRLREEVALADRRLLSVARDKSEPLLRNPPPPAAGVKVVDEGILLFVGDERGVDASAQTLGQQRLARARGALDCEIPEVQVPEV